MRGAGYLSQECPSSGRAGNRQSQRWTENGDKISHSWQVSHILLSWELDLASPERFPPCSSWDPKNSFSGSFVAFSPTSLDPGISWGLGLCLTQESEPSGHHPPKTTAPAQSPPESRMGHSRVPPAQKPTAPVHLNSAHPPFPPTTGPHSSRKPPVTASGPALGFHPP